MKFDIASLVVGLLLCGIALYQPVSGHVQQVRKDRRDLGWYQSWYKSKSGWTKDFGSYYLVSFDAGKTWYDAERAEPGIVLKGRVEETRPGLLEHLRAFDTLTQHVEKNGPISLSGPAAAEELKLLRQAGFTVTAREKN